MIPLLGEAFRAILSAYFIGEKNMAGAITAHIVMAPPSFAELRLVVHISLAS